MWRRLANYLWYGDETFSDANHYLAIEGGVDRCGWILMHCLLMALVALVGLEIAVLFIEILGGV
jgi:hypothetical protein